MAADVKVTIAKLHKAAHSAEDLRDKVADILATVKNNTEALGEPWGDDSYGTEFAKSYVPNRDELLDRSGDGKPGALPGLAKTFGDMSDAQTESAHYLQAWEDKNAEGFRRRA
ncbi:hypothetical protein AB0C34_01920 [Nocardia sp. NPDC049220]|uniref:hypothetical protein n=1 Tax=Nocardia sp. NPDC049220 TaxID=3155273 RepID=UPI0033EBBBDA